MKWRWANKFASGKPLNSALDSQFGRCGAKKTVDSFWFLYFGLRDVNCQKYCNRIVIVFWWETLVTPHPLAPFQEMLRSVVCGLNVLQCTQVLSKAGQVQTENFKFPQISNLQKTQAQRTGNVLFGFIHSQESGIMSPFQMRDIIVNFRRLIEASLLQIIFMTFLLSSHKSKSMLWLAERL